MPVTSIWWYPELDNYHNIAVRDHMRVPKFWLCDVLQQIPISLCQALHLLPSDLPNNFSQARSDLNRIMKNC